jgi:hypothetical protein
MRIDDDLKLAGFSWAGQISVCLISTGTELARHFSHPMEAQGFGFEAAFVTATVLINSKLS